ncbi:response regulator with CheY-like receiver domain and winged-helix DNA-binding domain [Sphaerochaeta pleomorpha str. Grapes]|uniref:Response regulator with CheY-like receiver domain and winged-helix DNA-binding domain n=1 Tax=Sphaerochaeta pleomorpha (strain ATCC BAA-1885 / DSM 22778 / Grapes) TaxID=158190 RepID=G8QTK3_SPHPG|nr:response regulator transcription factor [Sphaerochaeta pleomorpha]AEV27968.1 response regulator with CheY-like receiver domain and winged-helix DNA-binding domain [Sphaerochaeta pleomorpha str. Grapes]
MNTILVVDDDLDIRRLECFNLETNGYKTVSAENGKEALRLLATETIDAIILDIMMPVMDGLETIKEIRYGLHNSVPIIIASAKGDEGDIVMALELGADDYLTKPFSMKVMISKIKAVLRRMQTNTEGETIVRANNLTMDVTRHLCMVQDKQVDLTATEFALLYLLASNKEQVFTRAQIISKVKGNDYPVTDRSIDVQVATLRKKLGEEGNSIKTIWGIGYTFKEL